VCLWNAGSCSFTLVLDDLCFHRHKFSAAVNLGKYFLAQGGKLPNSIPFLGLLPSIQITFGNCYSMEAIYHDMLCYYKPIRKPLKQSQSKPVWHSRTDRDIKILKVFTCLAEWRPCTWTTRDMFNIEYFRNWNFREALDK